MPRWISKYVDNMSPMSYPVLYGDGELGLSSPSTQPGETVFRTLTDFRRQVKGSRAQLVPWVQDWNYTPEQVKAQVAAARLQGAKGYPALERLGDLHEVRARPRERATSRAESARATGRAAPGVQAAPSSS